MKLVYRVHLHVRSDSDNKMIKETASDVGRETVLVWKRRKASQYFADSA